MRSQAGERDQGSILILTLGFIIICVLAVAVVVDASTVFIQRRGLQGAVDSAALAGAQAIDLDTYYERGATQGLVLNPGAVQRAVAGHLRSAANIRLESVALAGDTVVVRATTRVRPPFSGWLTPGGAHTLTAEAGAQLVYRVP
jgi:Flp pilus assembly protein TadG